MEFQIYPCPGKHASSWIFKPVFYFPQFAAIKSMLAAAHRKNPIPRTCLQQGSISMKLKRVNSADSSFLWIDCINRGNGIFPYCNRCGRKALDLTDASGTGRLKRPLARSSFPVVHHGPWQVKWWIPPCRLWTEAAFRSLQNERMRAWRIMDFRCSAARRSRSSAVRIRPGRWKKWSSADNKSIKSFLYIRMDCYFRIKRSLIIGSAKNVPNFRKFHNIFIMNNW